jgi:DNA polymerase-3 subunit gamma/tau
VASANHVPDLVANGPGSIDVMELDAATHGLVDDARDLRDKAFFAPVQSRYKILHHR